MFKSLIKVREENGCLVDDRGIKYIRERPVLTIDIKFYSSPYVSQIPVSVKELSNIQKKLETFSPKPNAWLDAGKLKEGFETLELPDMDLDGTTRREPQEVAYEIRRVEFYHLGE
jgi:hypothetical protein